MILFFFFSVYRQLGSNKQASTLAVKDPFIKNPSQSKPEKNDVNL